MRPLVLGTAGHIDHGKTWLVRALTGKNTDRLPEEQKRGISIDLGYAPLVLPSGRPVSVIDVPGHERFVHTMVAGATGVDLVMLIVDAGEGARPQTHEHLSIVKLLGIEHGVVVITKADLADEELLELAMEEAGELMPGAPVVATSAKTGAGIDELRATIDELAGKLKRAPALEATRLFVDRSFSIAGIGTVVTGTLWSGSLGARDTLVAQPLGTEVRVRSVQVHDQDVARADAGQRVAVALPGVDRRDLSRGVALVKPGAYPVSYRLDIALEELEPLANGRRLLVHHGTSEHYARLAIDEGGRAQIRLRTPAVAARGDRVVLRDGTTVGGGVVLDPAPPRRLVPERFELLERGDPTSIVLAALEASPVPLTRNELAGRGLLAPTQLDEGLAAAVQLDGHYTTQQRVDAAAADITRALEERAESSPIDPGVPLAELLPQTPWSGALLDRFDVERRGAKGYLPGATAQLGDREQAAEALLAELKEAGTNPIKADDEELAAYLEGENKVVRLGDSHAIDAAAYEEAQALLLAECEAAGEITLARFRDLIGEGRRAAQLLLEKFDAEGVTRRVGDARVLRRRKRSS